LKPGETVPLQDDMKIGIGSTELRVQLYAVNLVLLGEMKPDNKRIYVENAQYADYSVLADPMDETCTHIVMGSLATSHVDLSVQVGMNNNSQIVPETWLKKLIHWAAESSETSTKSVPVIKTEWLKQDTRTDYADVMDRSRLFEFVLLLVPHALKVDPLTTNMLTSARGVIIKGTDGSIPGRRTLRLGEDVTTGELKQAFVNGDASQWKMQETVFKQSLSIPSPDTDLKSPEWIDMSIKKPSLLPAAMAIETKQLVSVQASNASASQNVKRFKKAGGVTSSMIGLDRLVKSDYKIGTSRVTDWFREESQKIVPVKLVRQTPSLDDQFSPTQGILKQEVIKSPVESVARKRGFRALMKS
jgi:hypothetical protein